MYNDIENDIVTLDLPNIVFAFPKGRAGPVHIASALSPLLIKIAKARPNWRLVGYERRHFKGVADTAISFKVFDDNTELGQVGISVNYNTGDDVFVIDNPRIRRKRQRGGETRTKDIKKAFKLITSEFHSKTTTELLTEASGAVASALSGAVSKGYQRHRANESATQTVMQDFALANWQQFDQFARQAGVPAVHLDTFHDAMEHYAATTNLGRAHHGDETTVVVLRGSEYILQNKIEGTRIVLSDQLSPHMKRAVGLLKLAEPNTFIPNVGVKATEDTMLVMPEQKDITE
jgi:hypothetical protein